MSAANILYRARQFFLALSATAPTSEGLEKARSVLTEGQMAAFERLQPSEQAHSLAVLGTLLEQGENNPDLLVAALLHDVGKVCHPLRLWERVVIVISKTVFPRRVKQWGVGNPRGIKRPFVISEQHPIWGAELVAETGASPLAVALVRRHQQAPSPTENPSLEDRLLLALQSADNQN
jgi:hypothetical protein